MKIRIIQRKLNNRSGESIAEVLVALLVASLALVILASMISSTSGIILTSKKAIHDYVVEENRLVEQSTTPDLSGNMIIKINNGSSFIAVKMNESYSDTNVAVDYFISSESGSKPVTSYKKQ